MNDAQNRSEARSSEFGIYDGQTMCAIRAAAGMTLEQRHAKRVREAGGFYQLMREHLNNHLNALSNR